MIRTCIFTLILVLALSGGAAVGEGEAGKGAKVAEDGAKGEEYWNGKQEKYQNKVQKKREEALRKAQEIERINRLRDSEMSGSFFNNWGFEWGSTDLEYPPIKTGDSSHFHHVRKNMILLIWMMHIEHGPRMKLISIGRIEKRSLRKCRTQLGLLRARLWLLHL